MGIVEFLEARIAEDEAVAQDAGARALEWRSSNGSVSGGGKPYVDDWSEDEPLTQYDGEVTIVYGASRLPKTWNRCTAAI